jgi:hypothetical protein
LEKRTALATAVATLGACGDFVTPAELTKPTVLAVIADPPLVAPGAASGLDVVVAGPDGPMTPDATSWRLIETFPGVPPFGAVVPGEAGGATFEAPDPVPELPENVPPISSVEVTVEAGEERIVVVKGMLVTDVPGANPAISALAVGAQVVGDTVTVAAGQPLYLDVGLEPPAGDDATFAWYSTVGGIERYQSNPAELIASEEPEEGWLFVVVRDGRGGVAWRGVQVTVE